MRIRLNSDIHLEHRPDYEPNLVDVDLYVLAGDVAEGIKSFQFCLKLLNKYPDLQIVHVAGNHEMYGQNVTKLNHRLKDMSNNNDRYHYLQNDSIVLGGYKFIGSTMWTDFNRMNPNDVARVWSGLNDYRYIRDYDTYSKVTPYRINKFHQDSVSYIFNELDNSKEPCIVITHHKPYVSSTRELSSAYEVDLYGRFENCKNPPKYWFSGHSHESVVHSEDYSNGSVTFMSNQLGYPFEKESDVKYNENLIISI